MHVRHNAHCTHTHTNSPLCSETEHFHYTPKFAAFLRFSFASLVIEIIVIIMVENETTTYITERSTHVICLFFRTCIFTNSIFFMCRFWCAFDVGPLLLCSVSNWETHTLPIEFNQVQPTIDCWNGEKEKCTNEWKERTNRKCIWLIWFRRIRNWIECSGFWASAQFRTKLSNFTNRFFRLHVFPVIYWKITRWLAFSSE